MQDTPRRRIDLLDALRGLSIILMVAYHCGFDLVMNGYIPADVLYNPLLDTLQPLFAGVFILLAGVSSRFSHNNLKRGLLLLGAAGLVSLAGFLMSAPIWFGILHLMAACVLLFWLFEKLDITAWIVPILAFLTLFSEVTSFPSGIESADYFPIVPWGFLFFAGTWLGVPIRDGRLPRWFYEARVPVLSWVGRRTLIIYLAHQPVLFGVLWLLGRLMPAGG